MANTQIDKGRVFLNGSLRQSFIELLQCVFWESGPCDQSLESIEDLIYRSERMS